MVERRVDVSISLLGEQSLVRALLVHRAYSTNGRSPDGNVPEFSCTARPIASEAHPLALPSQQQFPVRQLIRKVLEEVTLDSVASDWSQAEL